MMSLDREEFNAAMHRLEAGIAGIHARLDLLNGRTRGNEVKLATLETRLNVYVAVLSAAMTVAMFVVSRWLR